MTRRNRHHRIPGSRGGSKHKDNMKRWDVKEHADRHTEFGNKTPVEQLFKVLEVNADCFTEPFKKELFDLLVSFDGLYYKSHCLKDKTSASLYSILQ